MRFQPTYGNIWGVTYPLIFAGVSETIIDVTDTVFLAHYGTTELAAIGVADAVYGLSLFLVVGLVEATQIMVGRRAGQSRAGQLGQVFNQGLALLLLSSVLMIPLILFAAPALLTNALADTTLAHCAFDYLRIAAFALLFQALNMVISAFLIGIARTRVLIAASLVLAITNITLDSLLIFGRFGFPELGISGAAVATLSAEALTTALLLGYLAWRRYPGRYGLFRLGAWSTSLAARMTRLALPVALNSLVDMAKWFALLVIIEKAGEVPLAGANIVLACYSLLLIPVDSFSETVCSMISNLIGQKRLDEMALLIKRTIRLAYLVVAPLLGLVLLAPEWLMGLFAQNPEIIAAAAGGLIMVAAATIIAVPGDTWFSAVLGTGDTRAGLVIQAMSAAAGLMWAAWAGLVAGFGPAVILLSEIIGWAVCYAASLAWVRGRRWQILEV